ncbi:MULTISPECIES: hypothetical protein [Cyanophyceae]|uniref:hypothetical protein n=1 Tax=Cyanophyceae TaxID=3028117 RepID=UPI0016846043|nr:MULTISPECIES: hypothetical protein [Cyanophyceae]MBD1914781.1 hypothetical protein [Phormidium sp. FACHB-77]MBD2030884.1 hypothetical protein [Phormidium sp. FACHB-322]MBD2052482.1 hypothetical protein [Leptolyngbya sp. FACHB-60]
MSWLSRLLIRKKAPSCQPTAASPVSPSPPPESMAQVVVEETIMAVAKWLVSLVNRTMETQASSPKPEPPPPANPAEGQVVSDDTPPVETEQASAVDQLLAKFSGLIEEACDRTQAIALLEGRLQELESTLQATPDWQDSIQLLNQAVVKLDSRLSQVENILQQVDLGTISETLAISLENEAYLQQWAQTSTQQIAEFSVRLNTIETTAETTEEQHRANLHQIFQAIQPTVQQTAALEGRLSRLEKIVTRLSLVPKFVESNCRSIATLQNYVKQAKGSPVLSGNGNGSHKQKL